MTVELVTKNDLTQLKNEIFEYLSEMISDKVSSKKWLKSADVMEMLGVSSGTLQNLRVTGALPYSKVGGSIFYKYDDIVKILERK
jgi:hypothetical protein